MSLCGKSCNYTFFFKRFPFSIALCILSLKRVHNDHLRLLIVIVYNTLSPVGAYLGAKGEKSRGEQGKLRGRKGIDTACNKFAPLVAISCGGRGNILWRACEYLAAAAARPVPSSYPPEGGRLKSRVLRFKAFYLLECKDTKKKAEMQMFLHKKTTTSAFLHIFSLLFK